MREGVPTYLDYFAVAACSIGLQASASTWQLVLKDIWHVHYLGTVIEWMLCLFIPVVRCSLGHGSNFIISGTMSTTLPVQEEPQLKYFCQFLCGVRLWNPGIRGASKTCTKQFGIHNNSMSPHAAATGKSQNCKVLIYTLSSSMIGD